jgi:hypothetical protein
VCTIEGKWTQDSEYKHLGLLQTKREFDICSKELQEHIKGHSRASANSGKSPPKPFHNLVFLPAHCIIWLDMQTASCQTLSRLTSCITTDFWFSLKVLKRANHSYSHFPEPSADYSVRSNPYGQGGLVFQTWNIGMQINNLPMTLSKYCSWGKKKATVTFKQEASQIISVHWEANCKMPFRSQCC